MTGTKAGSIPARPQTKFLRRYTMIGGTIHFTAAATAPIPMRRQRAKKSPHVERLIELVKFYGRIELRDLAKLMGVTYEFARSVVTNATFIEGSFIYEDRIAGQTVIGWME